MPLLSEVYPEIRAALSNSLGSAKPDLGDGSFEAILEAFLGQSLEARAVANLIDGLRDGGWLDPAEMASVDPAEIIEAAHSHGVRITAKIVASLRRIAAFFAEMEGGVELSVETIREGLRLLNGVGPATADAILLHGMGRAAYPVDRASFRIFVRHGWVDSTSEYDDARDIFERREPDDPGALARLSSWMEEIGRVYCRASVAKCERCPLKPYLPEGGPLDPSS